MLSVFPQLLVFGLIAPFVLRAAAGLIFIWFGLNTLRGDRERVSMLIEAMGLKPGKIFAVILGSLEILGGIFLASGFFTQIAALLLAIMSLKLLICKLIGRQFGLESTLFYFLLFIVCISLLVSGPGFFAFDLPL